VAAVAPVIGKIAGRILDEPNPQGADGEGAPEGTPSLARVLDGGNRGPVGHSEREVWDLHALTISRRMQSGHTAVTEGADMSLRIFRVTRGGVDPIHSPAAGADMTAKKTTRSTTATASKRPSKKKSEPKAQTPAAETTIHDIYSLQIGTGFSLLTQLVPGGAVAVTRVPAGASLAVSYWKEPTHRAHPAAKVTRITMHVRLDGLLLPSLVVAQRDDADRLVRLSPMITVPIESKLFEYWFQLETDTNETLWDSNWGNNHWLQLEDLSGASPGSVPSNHAEA
jgi:hypothetical protein